MERQEEDTVGLTGETTVAPEPVGVEIEIEADATVGYTSIQNSVPVIRSLCITNRGVDALDSLQVLVACDPPFAQGANLRFERLAPSESRFIKPVDLHPEHAYLAGLTESVEAEIRVSITAAGAEGEIARSSKPLTVLAYDQWAGTRALPELLAAFCMPNNPAVDVLNSKASKLLREHDSALAMNGYQSGNREMIWKQISAIYSSICSENIQYSEPPASFGVDGQKIRTPERILAGHIATCLDLAMLFASCLEQAGLHPVVLIQEGHAWIGVWLYKSSFHNPITDDVQAIRKRVDSGEFLAFEATSAAQHRDNRPSLKQAMERGHAHLLDESSFRYAVDIHRAREAQIKPLPSKETFNQGAPYDSEQPEPSSAIESPPSLPPLDPAVLSPLHLPEEDSPAGRLSKWKSRLLDLTLRNRLLNFKNTKSTLSLIVPDLAKLEDALARGDEFAIRSDPRIMQGSDPRMAEVHAAREFKSPIESQAAAALKNKELLARVQPALLNGNLLTIFSKARTDLEDGGANTLFLALGFLRWTDTDKPNVIHLAPIILIPVQLSRQSVRSGFRLSRHEDEAIINPTLLQLLDNNFKLRIPGLNTIPVDEAGIDVDKILQIFRLAVADISNWEVVEEAHLGIFSFKKYLMWKDLQDRTEQLRGNRVVKHLIDHPREAMSSGMADEKFKHLDTAYGPKDICAPLLADSSQLKAICAADSGRDLVLEGPPGTGKSQTIANIIANSLAKGKTVLFVSEKMAALEVVSRRLNEIGLGPFCLELHSSKAKKAEVLQQLGNALEATSARVGEEWSHEAEHLAGLREELNRLVESLHRTYQNGLTVFEAAGTCIAHAGQRPSPMSLTDAFAQTRQELDTMRGISGRMAALAGEVGELSNNPLSVIGHLEWSPSWQDQLLDAVEALTSAIGLMKREAKAVGELIGIELAGLSKEAYGHIDELADIILEAPGIPAGLAAHAQEASAREHIRLLKKHGIERAKCWQQLEAGWKNQLSQLDASEEKSNWDEATSSWWLKSALAKRDFRKRIAKYREDGIPPTDEIITNMLLALPAVNEEDEALLASKPQAEMLLGDSFTGPTTNWTNVARYEDWAVRYADAIARIVGDQVTNAADLQQKLSSLVADNRALLTSDGSGRRTLVKYRDAWRRLQDGGEKVEALANPLAPLQGTADAPGALERMEGTISKWGAAQKTLKSWCLWRRIRDMAVSHGLQGVVGTLEAGDVALKDVQDHFEFSYRNWWLKKVMDRDPVLLHFSSAGHEHRIHEFAEVDEKFQALTKQYIVAALAANVPAHTGSAVLSDSELGCLKRELQKQRNRMPVRKLVKAMPTLLRRLKPCLLMSPLSVAQYLDAGQTMFDLVVFDEASQIAVWDAVGAIARGKQVVIVGDPKQLPPTNFFNKANEDEDEDDDGTAGDNQVEDLESILDECLAVGMSKGRLTWHYRSKYESLITFSNINYYDSELITFPSPTTVDNAVRIQRVKGIYDRGKTRTNRAEAEAVVAGIEAHYESDKWRDKTIGVVTFNQPQQALIETLLDARRLASQKLDSAIAEDLREPLFVKNLENVQGDERDVIFFSTTYGKDAAGRMTMNFGPLNSEGGQRRLNVAISRARERVVIYSSLLPEQIDLAKVRAAGVQDLKHYLEFAIRGPRALVEQSIPTGRAPDSPFEIEVIKVLRSKGWEVHPQVGCSGYRIDIGVVDPAAEGRYLAGIECDGRSYHSAATARDRDRLRQYILEHLGWHILRVWSTDWWLNPEREVEKLTERLEELRQSDGVIGTESIDAEDADVVAPEDVVVRDAATATNSQVAAKAVTPTGSFESVQVHSEQTKSDTEYIAAQIASAPQHLDAQWPIYQPATLDGGNSARFYAPEANLEISAQLRYIAEIEGPVLETVMFQRIARAWGLSRTGSVITERLRKLVPRDMVRTKEAVGTFYWPRTPRPEEWGKFRLADRNKSSQRHVNEVCIEELCGLVLYVLDSNGQTHRQDVARAVCRSIGMGRTPRDAEMRVGAAIDRLVEAGEIKNNNDTYWSTRTV